MGLVRLLFLMIGLGLPLAAAAGGSSFNYQGRLLDGGQPFNGTVDLEFRLFDGPQDGQLLAAPIVEPQVPISDGLFQIALDFGAAAFQSAPRYLEIRINGDVLGDRQPIRPAPMALRLVDPLDLAWRTDFAHLAPLLRAPPLPPAQLLPQACDQGRSPVRLALADVDRRVRAFQISEAVSEPYRAVVLFEGNPEDRPENLLGAVASLEWVGARSVVQRFPGIVTALTRLGAVDGVSYQALVIEPPMVSLRFEYRFRIFQDRTGLDVISGIFAEAGIAAESALFLSYPVREMQVQYAETTLDFVQRRLAREGIWFSFGDEGTLVLTDSTAQAAEALRLDYPGPVVPDRRVRGPALRSLQSGALLQPGELSMIGFRPETGEVSQSDARAEDGLGRIERLQGPFVDAADQLRAAELALDAERQALLPDGGWSDEPALRSGRRISISDLSGQGMDGTYLVRAVDHAGVIVPGAADCLYYGNRFDLLPPGLDYRAIVPPRSGPVAGPTHATVVGPSGETTYVDAFGRVKIRFHLDIDATNDENASGWIPVMRAFSRDARLPEVGETVIVDFLGGDPDRPLVTGYLPTATGGSPRAAQP